MAKRALCLTKIAYQFVRNLLGYFQHELAYGLVPFGHWTN